jgi:hypothetical protein
MLSFLELGSRWLLAGDVVAQQTRKRQLDSL